MIIFKVQSCHWRLINCDQLIPWWKIWIYYYKYIRLLLLKMKLCIKTKEQNYLILSDRVFHWNGNYISAFNFTVEAVGFGSFQIHSLHHTHHGHGKFSILKQFACGPLYKKTFTCVLHFCAMLCSTFTNFSVF